MSNRDSMGFGDLIPQDVVDIFAQEKHGKSRKKRSHSLGRALGWLKGKKRKDLDAKGQGLGLGPALDLALDGHPTGHQGGHKGGQKGKQTHPQGNGHAVPKRDDDDKTPAPPLLQENVFIEASRPEYLENLHTEALEGLKMMQQEETNNGMEFQDNESTISTMSVQTDGEGGGFMTDSTIADTSSVVSVQSSVSTRSSRSGLTRQESTFRPLNSGKKSEKTKTKRRHRKTVGGIPQHVQRELGLDRAGWTVTQRLDEEQLYNGDTENSPTTDDRPQRRAASQQGASTSLQNINHPLSKDQLDQLGASHKDDLALLHRLGPDVSDGQRTESLAVPWMTTANSLQADPPSPVMSMSPQAAYMSKIIPNAVLPPSIEVVEISRGRSRNSVRTVSKSSLVLSSPSPSRASSRASNRTTSSRSSNITSASRHNPPNVSDSSCWSNSDSSETLVSESSTISRSTTPTERRAQDGNASAKEDKISVHSSNSKASRGTSNGRIVVKGGEVKKDGPFTRSLSVMKPKKAPPPPNRSYSLHNKMKRRSRDLTEVNPGEENEKNKQGSSPATSKAVHSPGYNADISSLEDSAGSGSFSPIRSQQQAQKAAGTVPKEKQKPHQENKLSKTVSLSSGYSSQDGTSGQVHKPPHKKGILAKLQRLFPASSSGASPPRQPKDLKPVIAVDTVDVSPSVRALIELFNIPPPPKIHAPPPPPPEVWAHSRRSVELLLGPPVPDNLQAIIKKNPKDRRQQRQSPSVSTEGSVKSLAGERKHSNQAVPVGSVNGSVHVLETKKVQESVIVSDRLAEQNVDLKGNSEVTEKVEKARGSDLISGMLAKALERRERLEAVREEEEGKKAQTTEVTLPSISLIRMPPSPAPPLVHHPPQQTTSPESSWPPPPPPLVQVGLNGTDDVDLPLPPPPMFGEVVSVVPVLVPPESAVPGGDPSTSVTSVVKIEAEPLNIPPPPPYSAPPPPVKVVSPPATKKAPPPPPPIVVSSPPPTEVSPPPPIVVSPPPPKEIPPSPPKEVSPPPPKEIPPSPPKEVSPPPPKEIPPSPPKEVSPPPPKEIPPSPPKEVSPPPPKESPPSPPKEVSPESPPLVNDVSITLVTVVSPPVKEVSPPLVVEDSTEEVSPPSSQENPSQSSEEVTPVIQLAPPESIPPPPPKSSQPEASVQMINPPQESIPPEPETKPDSSDSILAPPQSIPPVPPIQPLLQPQSTDGAATQEPSAEVSIPPEKAQEPAPANIPVPPPLPVQGFTNIKDKPSPASTEIQTPEKTSAPVVQEELTPIVTPSLLQTVKLRSVNSSPEPPKAPEPPEDEVTIRKQQPSNPVASVEAPQKPIRRSLILLSPTSPPSTSPPPTSPPATVTAQPVLPLSQSTLVPPSSPPVSPTKKTPPATTAPHSMNLQEAIRLRTAARSKAGPPARLSLHSPTSPKDFHKSPDLHKSPTSTASFIFSKSHRRVVIETKPAPETIQKKMEVSSAELAKKVPPPVAKKPKKGKEMETSEGTEQTEALQESHTDAAEKSNGTAGTVEGGGAPSS